MRPSDDADKGGLGTGAPIVQVYHEKSIILPDVSRVLACLYEKDIKFETHTASYKSLLRLQASSHAPVPFYDGPTFLEESRGICRYIAEKYEHQGYPFLLGKDALERASVEQWLHNEEHAFNPPSRALYCHLAFPLDEEDGDDIDLHTRKLEEVLEVYEQRLSDSRFLAGNKFTLADLVHLPNSHYIKSSEKFVYLYDSRKNVNRWWEEISTRTSWQQVLRDMKRVEEQNRQEELKKQQQQKEHPRTSGHPIRIDSKKHISTEPRTILVPPADTMSSSSIVRPLPTDSFPNAAVVSSSQIIPTADKTSDVLNKETTIFNAPDETTPTSVQSTPTTSIKHPIPVQSIKDDASPTTAKKPPIADDAKYSSKDTSIPESTVEDLHTRQEPNSSKDDSKNFDVFDYYPSHSDEDTPYMKPTPQRTLEISDASSGSNIASGYTKPSSLSAKEEPDQPSASDIYKSDSRATGIDSQYKESGPYSGRTPPKQEPIDTSANKLHTSDVHHKLQAEKWHIATTGLNDLNQDADHLMSTQQGKPSKDVKQYTSQDSEQSTSDPVPEEPMSMEPVQRQENTTGRPYTDQRSRGIVEDTASSDQRSALLLPSIQQHDATPSRQEAAKYGRERIPSQAEYPGGQDINQQPRDPASVPRQRSAQDVRGTFGESKAADSTISSESYPDASRSSLPRQDLDGVRYTTAPFQKRYPGTKDTSKQSKHKISTPWQMADKHAEDTAEETKSSDSSSSQVQPSYFQRADAPSWKQETSKDRYSSTPAIEEKHDIVKDTTGMSRDVAFKPKQAIGQDDQDNFKETKSGGPSLFRNQQPDTWQAASTSPDQEVNQDGHSVAPPSQTRYQSSTHPFETRHQIGKDASKQPRGTAPTPKKKALKDDNGTSEELNTADEVAPTEQLPNVPRAPISPRRQEVDNSSMTNTSFQRRYPDDKEDMQVADTASASRQIAPDGGEGIFEETKLADSTTSEKPLYIQQTALPLPRQAEVEDGGKGRHSRVTIPEQQKMVGRDAQDTRGERQTTTPGEESSDLLQAIPQSSPAAAKDVQSATSETMQFPAILDTTKKSRGAFEETKDPDSTLPRAQSLGARDAQHAIGESRPLTDDRRKDVSRQLQPDAQDPFQQSKLSAIDQKGLGSLSSQERDAKDAQATTSDDKSISTERHKEMIKREPQDSIKVEKISSIYQKRPPVAKDRQEQSQIIEADEKANGSTPKHQQVPDTMYTLDDKLKTTAAPNAKTSFDFGAEETYRKDTTNDQKLVPPLLSKEPPSQVQPTSGSLQDEASNGRLSTKPSTIEQWQRTSVPLNDVTSSSGDDEIGMVTIDQKLTPMSQQATPSAESGNRMAKNSAEKRVEPHVPSEAETSGVRSASPSFPEASTGHHDTTDDKFPKQSIIDGRVEESRKMQTSTPDSAPAHTRIGTPGGHEIGDSELVSIPDGKIPDAAKTRHGQGTLQEDVHDANLPTHDVAKDTFTETEVVDFRPSSAKPMYTQRPAPTPRHAEAEDTRNKGTKGRETVPDQQKIVERRAGTSDKQLLDRLKAIPPSRQAPAESSLGATGDTIQSPDIHDTSKKSRGTYEEAKSPGSVLSKAQSLGAQDAQRTTGKSKTPTAGQRKDVSTKPQPDVQDGSKQSKSSVGDWNGLGPLSSEGKDAIETETTITGDKPFPMERLMETSKKSESTTPKKQPTGSQGSVKEEKTPSAYQKKPPVAQDSQHHSDAPNTFDEKFIAPEPARAKTHDAFSAKEPYRDDTPSDQKLAPTLLSRELTSQVQPSSEPSHDASLHRDLSSKPSTIDEWRLTSAPLHDVTTSPGDDEVAMSTVDQKPTPMRQQESGEQRVEPPFPMETETSGVQRASPSFPGASVDGHATTDDRFAKQSIIDERDGKPVQMQTSSPDAHLASEPAKRETPKGHEISDLDLVSTPDGQISEATKARDDPATVPEDVYDVNLSTHDVTKDTFKETKVADSTPFSSVKPMHTQQPAITPSRQTQIEEARYKSMPSREIIPEQQKMAEREAGISGEQSSDPQKAIHPSRQKMAERGAGISGEESSDRQKAIHPSRQVAAAEDAPTGDAQDSQLTKGEPTMPTAEQKDWKDAKDDETIMTEEKSFSTERLREMFQESESTIPKTQPTDSQDYSAVDKTFPVYQKGPLAAQESQEEAQVIQAGEKEDSSTPEHQGSSGAPYTHNEKLSASAPARANIRDDHNAEEPYKKYTANDQKVAPSLPSKDPASQVQPLSESFQRAIPDGDSPSKSLTIDQWQRASAPLHGVSIDSGDAEAAVSSNNDQKSRPTSQEATLSSPAPIGADTSDVGRPAPSLPEAARADDVTIDDKLAKQAQPPASTRAHQTVETPHISNSSQYVQTGNLGITELAKPTVTDQEAMGPIAGRTSMDPQRAGTLPAEVAHSAQKSTPADKGSSHDAQPLSSAEPISKDSTVSAADYSNASQTIFRQQARPSEPSTIGIPASDTHGVIGKIQEVTPDNSTDDSGKTFVPSQEQVSHASKAIPGEEEMTSPPGATVFPTSDTKLASPKIQEVIPDDKQDIESITPLFSSRKQGSQVESAFGPGEVGPAEKKFAPSDQELHRSVKQPTSGKPRKEQTIVPAADQIKKQPTIIGQQDTPDTREALTSEDVLDTTPTHGDVHPISSIEPDRRPLSVQREEPTSATQEPPHHVAEDSLNTEYISTDALGNVQSKPSTPDALSITPGSTPDDVLVAEQISSPSGQDSVDPAEPALSLVPRNKEIRDSTPPAQLISSTDPSKGDAIVAVPDQAKDFQTTLGRQDLLSTQRPSGKVRENVPGDDSGKDKPLRPSSAVREGEPSKAVPASVPGIQPGSVPNEVALEQHFAPSGQDSSHPSQPPSSAEARSKEIGDLAPSAQLDSTTEQTNADAVVAALDQAKDSQTIPGQQVKLSAPSSYTQRPSGSLQEDEPTDNSGEAKSSKPRSVAREGKPSAAIPVSSPDTQHGATPDQVAVDEQKFDLSGQDAARSVQSTFSTEPTKEDTFIAATDQTSTREKVVYQNDMTPASDKEKTLFTGTPYASRETKKSTDDHIDEKHPGQRRVSPYRDVSERPEGPTPEVHSDDVIKEGPTPEVHSDDVIKETTFGSSQAETSKTIPDSTPIGDDARPSSGDVQASSLPETQDPLGSAYAHNVPADPLQKIKSSGLLSSDQALAPIMSSSVPSDASLGTVTDSVQPPQKASMASTVDLQSVPDAQHGIPQGEATPAEKKFPVSDQEPPHTLEPSSSAEPRKEEAYAVAGDQKDVPQGPERAGQHQVNALSSDARETLQKDQQPSHAVLPEQSTHTVPSDLDRPTPEVGSTVVDKETRLLSRQAQTLAAEPAPTLISGDVSPTSSLHNQDAQPPVTTQAPTTQSLQGSAPTQDDPLNRSESSPRRYSTDQVVTPRTSSAEPSGLPQGTEPGQDSSQSIQPPFSTEPTKDNTVPDKHMEIMTHQKAITPTQDTAKTPFPGTDQEAMAPIAESVDPQLASTLPAEVADSEQKSAPSEKGSTRAEEPLSPVEPKKADSNVSAAEYTNAPQMIFRQQAKPSAPSTIAIPASDTQGVIGKIQEGTPDRHTDDSGKQYVPNQEQVSHASLAIPGQEEMTSSPDTTVSLTSATQLAKAEVQESSPDNQQAIEPMTPLFSNGKQGSRVRSAYGPGEIDPAEKKFAPSDQELLHSAEQPTSGRPRKEQVVPTAEQIKEHPSIIGQQDTPDIREDPTSEDVLDTTPTHGDVHPTSSTEPDRRPLSVQRRELTSATQAPLPRMAKDSLDTEDTSTDASVQSLKQSMAPDDRGITPGSTPGHIAVAEQIYSPSGQDSAESIQPPFSTEPIEDKTVVNASDQTKDVEAVTRQQAITPAPDTVKTPFPGTQDASRKNQESIPDNGHVNEPFPREQVPPEGSSSELHEGQTNVPYGTNVNEKTDTSLSSQANSSDSGSDLAPTRSDVRPSIDEGPDGIYFPVPGSQTQMPAATQDVSLDSPSKVKSTGQEAKTPTGDLGSSLDTKPDSSQTRDQEFSRASKSSSFAEPRKEETDVAAADQMSVPQTTVAHKVTSATPVARESLWKDQESSHDGDHISNSANQLVISEDKASHVGRASEGPSSEVSSAVVDRKISPPSSKAHTSSTGPESTSISGDDHLSSADAPPTSSLHDKEVHTPAATQLGSTQAPLGSASTQNVTADSLGEIRSPRQPSTDQVMAPITSSEVLADAPQGTAPDQVSAHASQPSFSAEPSNETSHAGRASESHEGTTPEVHSPVVDAKTILPSRKVQTANTGSDSTPSSGDVSDRSSLQNQETQSSAAARVPIVQAQGSASSENESIDSLGDIKSPRQLPTKISFTAPSDFSQGTEPGTNSVQSSEEASLDFSSDEKPTTGQDDQFKTPNGGLSTSQVVGESESADSKWMDYKNFKGASADENSKKQQQIEQFDTRFKNNNKEADTTVRSNITTTFEEPPKQPSWPKGSMESSEEPENQQQTDQSVQSLEGNDNQAKQTKAHDTEMSGPEDMEASENTNQRNRISQVETLDHSGKEASGVQLLGKNTKDAPNSTEDAPGDVQAISKSKESSRLSEESKAQLRSEDKIGAPESPSAETGKPRGGLPENSYQNNSSQSQAEASDKSVQQTYPGIQNKDRDSADPTKPGDMED